MRSNNEDNLQKAVIRYFKYQHPKTLIHHSPNGGKRDAREGKKFKDMGTIPGFPDLIIPAWKTAIELKSEKGKLQDSQRQVLSYLKSIGWLTFVCYSFEEAEKAIEQAYNQHVKEKQVA